MKEKQKGTRNKVFRCCLYLVLSALLGVSTDLRASQSATTSPDRPTTVMGLGDSITEGGNYFQCYLFPLWEKLFTAGFNIRFIGPKNSKCPIGTIPHSGYSGRNARFLELKIDSIYRLYPADIVLLHAGHNYFAEEKPVQKIIDSQRSIIKQILSINPQAKVLVAQVIPAGKLPKYSYIPKLNREIAQMVKQLNNPHILLVNQAQGFNWRIHTVKDKVHPNAQGAQRMATTWFKTLKTILPAPHSLAPTRRELYKTVGDTVALRLHLFEPQGGKRTEPRAVVLFLFGGGWVHGSPLQFYRECQYYASHGLVAVSAEYRITSLHNSNVFQSLDDARDAVLWLRTHAKQLNIDPNRIVVAGASAGGHLAAACATSPKEQDGQNSRPNLLLLYYPVVDNSDKGYGSTEMKQRYREISPLHNLTAGLPPTLFLLGTHDALIPVSTGKEFCRRMQELGNRCELHLIEGGRHPLFAYRETPNEMFYRIRELTDRFLEEHNYIKP